MKTFTHLLCVLILSIVLFACNNVHFLKEESYQNQVAQDFEQKKQALPHGDLFAIFADSILSAFQESISVVEVHCGCQVDASSLQSPDPLPKKTR